MKKDNSLAVILESENFKHFLKEVRAFCHYIEANEENGNPFLETIATYFLQLYSHMLKVDLIEILYDYDSNHLDNDYDRIAKSIGSRIPIDYYWEVYNPLDFDDHTESCGSLIDDITDIYLDLKRALIDFDTGQVEATESAVFNFKWGFSNHWGQHLVSGLKIIHWHLNH